MSRRAVLLAADHAGYELKQDLARHLADLGYEAVDLGTDSPESVDYPDYAHLLAEAIERGQAAQGILCCGAGIGMSIAANRHPGVRAANCLDERMAALAREHNDANVLCLGSRVTGIGLAEAILSTFINTPFDGDRHTRRVAKVERKSGG